MSESTTGEHIGGGSLLIAWQLKDKNVLIVGGGEVAAQRINSILTTDAHIIVVGPEDGLHSETRRLITVHKDRVTYHDRLFSGPPDLIGVDMILTALDDVGLSRQICDMCRSARIPVNAADIPELCDFYFGSQIRDGPLQIMISTNGNGPKMANIVKTKLQQSLSGFEGQAITTVGKLRNRLKIRAPGTGGDIGKKRMRWMSTLCSTWNMEDLAALDDDDIEKLLDTGWEQRRVPRPTEIGQRRVKPKAMNFDLFLPSAVGFAAGVFCVALVSVIRRRSA